MDALFEWPPGWATWLLLPALFVAFTVHELAHALVAYLLGDTSQVERKRLSLNPLRHVSWLGLVAFLLVGIGWAKPVWVDWSRFRIKNRALGMFLVSIAGAGANLLTALAVALGMAVTGIIVSLANDVGPMDAFVFLITHDPGPDAAGVAVALSTYMLEVNLVLALFNLLPLPPLDGFQALMSLFALIRNALRGQTSESSAAPTVAVSTREAGEADALRSPAQIHFDIALDYQKAGELDEAIARYRQALAHDEDFALAYYNLGLAYLAKGRLPLATSAFKAALGAQAAVGVHVQANARLQELARAGQDPGAELGPLPEPLEPGVEVALPPAEGATPLDPVVARRLWLRLSLGGALLLLVALSAWVFVTAVTLGAVG